MPQLQLPIFYDGVNPITNDIGYERRDGSVVYYCGTMPIFSHQEDDLDSFRTITCQFYVNGNAGQTQIARAFGIKEQALKRWVKRYREMGPKTFYQPRKTRGKSTVLTPEVRARVQLLLDTGAVVSQIAKELGIGYDTVRKAVADGRLVIQKKRVKIMAKPSR
jgi:transposase-like protein